MVGMKKMWIKKDGYAEMGLNFSVYRPPPLTTTPRNAGSLSVHTVSPLLHSNTVSTPYTAYSAVPC